MGLNIPITATDNNVMYRLEQVARKIDAIGAKSVSSNRMIEESNNKLGASFGALATKIGASVAAIASVQKLNEIRQTVTQVRGEFEQLEISLTTILGSKAEADKLMAQIVEFAAKTPFDMKGVASGVKQLLAYGSEADNVIDEMRMIGDIASGLSIPLGDLVYLYGTTRTQGRMFTQDLRQFMGRGIPLAEELAKQFGVTKSEVGELVTAGKVGFNEMYKALQAMTSEGGKFYNLMDSQSRSILGMQSNAEDARDQMYNEIGKLLQGVTAKGIEAQNYLYENYEKIGKTLLELVGIYGTYKAVLITVSAIQKAHIAVLRQAVIEKKLVAMAGHKLSSAQAIAAARTKILNTAMKGLLTTLKQISKAMFSNPYVLASAAVAGLAYGIYKLVTAKSAEEKALEATNKKWKEYDDSITERLDNSNSLISAMKDETKSSSERMESMRKLVQQYPQLLDKYGEEALMLMDIKKLKQEIVGIESANKKSALTSGIEAYSTLIDKLGSGDFYDYTSEQSKLLKGLGIQPVLDEDSYSYYFEGTENNINAITKAMSELQRKYYEMIEADQDAEFQAKPIAERIKIYEEEAERAKNKVAELNEEIDKLGKGRNAPSGDNILTFFYDATGIKDLQAQRDAAQKDEEQAIKNAEALRKKQEEDREKADKKARDEQKKAQKEVEKDLLKSNNDLEKAKIQSRIETARYVAKNEAEAEKEIHKLRLQLIEIEKQQSLDALDAELTKYIAIYKAAGKSTTELEALFGKMRENTIASFGLKTYKENASFEQSQKDRNEAELDAMIEYNIQYGNVMEQRANIVQKYTRAIAKAESEGQKEMLEAEMGKELRSFDLRQSDIYQKMFISASGAFSGQINEAISLLDDYIQDLIYKGLDPASDEIQNLIEKANELKDALRGTTPGDDLQKLLNYGSIEGVSRVSQELKSVRKSQEQAEDDFFYNDKISGAQYAKLQAENAEKEKKLIDEQKLQRASVVMQSVASAFGTVTDSLKEFAEETGDKTAGAIADTFSAIQGGIQAFMQGGILGFAMYGISMMVDKILEAAIAASKARKNIENINKEFEKLQYEVSEVDYDTIFGTLQLSKVQEAYEKAQKALVDYQNAVDKKTDLSPFTPGGLAILKAEVQNFTDLERMIIDTGEKGEDRYKTLRELSDAQNWQIWDNEGALDPERLETFLDANSELSEEQKEQIQNVLDLHNAYEEAQKIVEQLASDIVGHLASDMTEAIFDAVENGADAFDDFQKAGAEAIKNLGKLIVQELLIKNWLKGYSERIEASLGGESPETITDIIGALAKSYPDMIKEATDAAQKLYDAAEDAGIDMDVINPQETTSRGFQTMSQETGDELNGRFTDIQSKTGAMLASVNEVVQINSSVLANTSTLITKIVELFGIALLQLKELSTISNNTAYLGIISEDIAVVKQKVKEL